MITEEFVAAVRPLIRWAREHYDPNTGTYTDGWGRASVGFRNPKWRITFERGWVEWCRFDKPWQSLDVESTQQAIDILVAVGALPTHLSSAFQAGRLVTLTEVVEAILTPDAEPGYAGPRYRVMT